MSLRSVDIKLIRFCKRVSIPVARAALFVVFFWFGVLKMMGLSPASGLIQRLSERSIPFAGFHSLIIFFGLFECLIGLLFLIKGAERIVIPLLLVHMISTFGPLFFLPHETWSGFLTPTLEGQYIIKNLALIAAGIGIAAHMQPLPETKP